MPKFLAFTVSQLYPLVAGASLLAWAMALCLQYLGGMEPCSLCILQRWALTGVLLSSVLATVWERRTAKRLTPLVVACPAIVGVVVASKHLWLQLVPPAESAGCGFGGAALLENLPLTKALPALFAGSGECATLPPVAGLPLPAWALMLFLVVLVGCVTRYKWLASDAPKVS